MGTITAAGVTANLALKYGQLYEVQCDGDARFRTGAGSGTAVANSGATKGRKVLADSLVSFETDASQNYVAVIPADGASTIHCDVFLRPKVNR